MEARVILPMDSSVCRSRLHCPLGDLNPSFDLLPFPPPAHIWVLPWFSLHGFGTAWGHCTIGDDEDPLYVRTALGIPREYVTHVFLLETLKKWERLWELELCPRDDKCLINNEVLRWRGGGKMERHMCAPNSHAHTKLFLLILGTIFLLGDETSFF